MQIVLYTDDMEAITVIDLPSWFLDGLHAGRMMRVPVPTPPMVSLDVNTKINASFKMVDIWAERFIRKGKQTWFLFTNNDEAALLLRSDILPGQRKTFQDEYRRGFFTGLLRSMQM